MQMQIQIFNKRKVFEFECYKDEKEKEKEAALSLYEIKRQSIANFDKNTTNVELEIAVGQIAKDLLSGINAYIAVPV